MQILKMRKSVPYGIVRIGLLAHGLLWGEARNGEARNSTPSLGGNLRAALSSILLYITLLGGNIRSPLAGGVALSPLAGGVSLSLYWGVSLSPPTRGVFLFPHE